MTEENAADPYKCPAWCVDTNHAGRANGSEIAIHDSRGIVTLDPSSVVMYASQTVWRGKPEPAVVHVAATFVPDGERPQSRLDLSADQARAMGLIITDAAKGGMKGVRTLARGLRELSAEIAEPEAGELEAEA